jgi:hypothetical protein
MSYNLDRILKNVIRTKHLNKYISRLRTIHNYDIIKYNQINLIEKDDLIATLKRSIQNNKFIRTTRTDCIELLTKLENNDRTEYDLTKEDIDEELNKNYFDIGRKLIFYNSNKIDVFIDNDIDIYLNYDHVLKCLDLDIDEEDIKLEKYSDEKFKFHPDTNYENSRLIFADDLYLTLDESNEEHAEFMDYIDDDVVPAFTSYNAKYNKITNFDNYGKKSCLYIFRIQDNLYKFGVTNNVKRRINNHKHVRLLKDNSNIIDIFVLDNKDICTEIENKFKIFCADNNSTYKKKLSEEILTDDRESRKKEKNSIAREIFKTNHIHKFIKYLSDLVDFHNELSRNNMDFRVYNKCIETCALMEKANKKNDEIEKKIYADKKILDKLQNENSIMCEIIMELTQKNNIILSEKQNMIINSHLYEIKKCSECDVEISLTSEKCSECINKTRFLENRNNRPPMKELVINFKKHRSFVAVGKLYNKSDNTVRKWIKTYLKYSVDNYADHDQNDYDYIHNLIYKKC